MAMTDDRAAPEANQWRRPRLADLDREKIEVIYDYDLDELTMYFYGVNVRHTVMSVSEEMSALVNRGDNEMVGFILHRFLRQAAVRDPELLPIIGIATLISGDQVVEPHTHSPNQSTGWKERIQRALNALLGRPSSDEREAALRHLDSIPALS